VRPSVTPSPDDGSSDDGPRGHGPGGDGRGGGRPAARDRPVGLRVALAGIGLEALLLALAAVVVLGELVAGGSSSAGVSIFLALFFAGVAWALVASARALWAGRRVGRAPVVTWQILQGVVGVSALTAGAVWAVLAGVALIGVAVAVIVLLMTRPVLEATTD
jgi:hypothetical protein